jgi:NADPH:quinone reductase-like Zn-dependent oxidoreductase
VKAAVIAAAGAAPVHADFADPEPAEGTQIVELVGSGIHQLVRSLAAGRHYGSDRVYPMIPGVDAVARTADGDLIYTGFVTPPHGTMAERMRVPGGLPLPAGADPLRVAAGINPGMSSWLPLTSRERELRARDAELDTVLVLGATGVSGTLAVQNAVLKGAKRVVAVGRDAKKLARAERLGAGATATLSGDVESDASAIAAALDGATPTLVLDYVWGAPAQAAFRALGRAGLTADDADISYVEVGAMAGAEAALPASLLRSRNIRLSGSGAGAVSIADVMSLVPVYMDLIAAGEVEVPMRAVPLSRVGEAWELAGRGGDRVVVIPD